MSWLLVLTLVCCLAGVLGFPLAKGGASPRWQAVLQWAHEPRLTLGASDAAMQVYASYDLRRDFVAAAVTGAHLARAVPLSPGSHEAALPPFAMPRSLAWRLAQRPVEQVLRARATAALLAASGGATQVRDLELEVHFTRVAAAPVRLPAYVLSFTHGTTVAGDQSIVPERFTAVVGAVSGNIGCTELLSPRKAQLAAASPLLLLGLLGELLSGSASLSVGMESAFFAAVAGVLAGVAARRLPYNRHTAQEAAVLRECDAAAASSPSSWMDERAQRSRDDAEWLRWEHTGLWGHGWDPKRRQEWAQTLFRGQVERARGRATRRRQDAEQAAAAEEEAVRHAAKAARWGSTRASGASGSAPLRPQSQRDPLGYYQLLGLPAARVGVATDEEIKAAYLAQAQRLHPDKHTHGDVAAAADAFRKLQAAYSTLRDAHKRAVYLRSA